jgi:hypothetical protein
MTAADYIALAKELVPLFIGALFIGFLLTAALACRPIVVRMVNGLADRADGNAMAFGLAMGYGLSASLSALAEQATALNWLILAALAKVINPFIVGVLAFTARSSRPASNDPPPAPPAPPHPHGAPGPRD